ncbi:hypothetical protein ANANG_G00294640 [Anguilla anguilla]|uniref:Uncharacterized protein n=1 Tax=Anguilla anguilla TaxID=7936 RepID=A0A9D3RJN0_ANGAN|nr:hypothetical protein ANANG_G00294640 [Anguilla anguilla]
MSTPLALHLQTQVVSIVEALAKSAIAEIRKVIDEGTEVSCLEMSRSKKENETLKRRLLQMEKELEAARKGIKIRAVAGDRIRNVNEQIGDEIRGADAPSSDNYVSEKEQPFSIDGVFLKECSVSLWKEEVPMQPVTNEEGTQTGEDKAGLYSGKVEQFEENLEDSEPHGGLQICDGVFQSGRDSTEPRCVGEESDALPAPAEATREPDSPPAAAGADGTGARSPTLRRAPQNRARGLHPHPRRAPGGLNLKVFGATSFATGTPMRRRAKKEPPGESRWLARTAERVMPILAILKGTRAPAPAEAGTVSVKKPKLSGAKASSLDSKRLKTAGSVANTARRRSVVYTTSKRIWPSTGRSRFAVTTAGNII